jgi:hypothetical protein
LEHLDETPGIAQLIQTLQHGLDLIERYEGAKQTYLDPDGAKLSWPKERDKALGMKLLLLRAFATEKIDVAEFGAMFIPSGESLYLNASVVVKSSTHCGFSARGERPNLLDRMQAPQTHECDCQSGQLDA